MISWRQYWESDTSVYVSARHRNVHYALLADQLRAFLRSPDAHVLDYGCGEALLAGELAEACRRLDLLDGAERVRGRLAERFCGNPRIHVLAPEDLESDIGDGSLDLVILNSVLQYLGPAERDEALARLARKLAPGGELVVADVIPPGVGPAQDALALLRFAAANGFLLAAVSGLAKALFSRYRTVRSALGLARYDQSEMLAILDRAGLTAARQPHNLGHNDARMAFLARRKTA